MCKLEIQLKQHTPLIHFQHDQDGATLRASEVKPKLDKFIIKHSFHDNFEECKEYLVGYDPKKPNDLKTKWNSGYRALNYKMRINSDSLSKHIWKMENDKGKSLFPSFFGNQKSDPEKIKELVFTNHQEQKLTSISIIIFTSHEELLKKVDSLKEYFFLTHNFGTRQSKGFGNYFPINNEIKNINDNRIKNYYRFIMSIPIQNQNWEKVYKKLDENLSYFYKSLRSGINIEPFYFKSLMFFYALKEEKYYDKRTIREHYSLFFDKKNKHPTNNGNFDKGEIFERKYTYNQQDARLYRDMLGLSSSQSWQKYNGALISKENSNIERFKSPLLIKPFITLVTDEKVEFIVLIIPSIIPDIYYNQVFAIKKDGNNETVLELKTPEKEEFSIEKFLMFSLSKNEMGFKKAIEQLNNTNYEQWKIKYLLDNRNFISCKKRLNRNNSQKVSTDDIMKELEKEANKKIKKANDISNTLKAIYNSFCCPNN